jgi:hypothetical protein
LPSILLDVRPLVAREFLATGVHVLGVRRHGHLPERETYPRTTVRTLRCESSTAGPSRLLR